MHGPFPKRFSSLFSSAAAIKSRDFSIGSRIAIQAETRLFKGLWIVGKAFLKLFLKLLPWFLEHMIPVSHLSFNLPFWTRIFISFRSQLNQFSSSFAPPKPDMTRTEIFIPELQEKPCGARDGGMLGEGKIGDDNFYLVTGAIGPDPPNISPRTFRFETQGSC
jgi:hypothetical protein